MKTKKVSTLFGSRIAVHASSLVWPACPGTSSFHLCILCIVAYSFTHEVYWIDWLPTARIAAPVSRDAAEAGTTNAARFNVQVSNKC